MKNYYINVTIKTLIEVVDVDNVEEAKLYIKKQIEENYNLPDYCSIELEVKQ